MTSLSPIAFEFIILTSPSPLTVDPRDRGLLGRVREAFPFVDPFSEPALLELPASWPCGPGSQKASGCVVVTARHLLLAPGPSLFRAPSLKVVPLRTIASIAAAGRVRDLSAVNGGPSSGPADPPGSPSGCVLAIRDVSGQPAGEVELARDLAGRLADLLEVIIRVG